LQALDDGSPFPVNPLQRSRLLTPADPAGATRFDSGTAAPGGGPTRRVVVCLHGLSNGPQQFVRLCAPFVAAGDSVLLPRLPSHGFADRLTTELVKLTAPVLVDATAEAIDLAAGLADEVLVTGLSLGGILAAWASQFRPVARAVPIAPSIGLPRVPAMLNRLAIGAALRLPNVYLWWNRRLKERNPGPPYAYPRFSTYALARTQRLGFDILAVARRTAPRAAETWMVTNGADPAVNNRIADSLVGAWRRRAGGRVHAFTFPARLGLSHDIVDPLQPYQRVALTHPALVQIIGQGRAPDPASSGW
jgi:alpha-beta hydrolase superfamily lysophospholipase